MVYCACMCARCAGVSQTEEELTSGQLHTPRAADQLATHDQSPTCQPPPRAHTGTDTPPEHQSATNSTDPEAGNAGPCMQQAVVSAEAVAGEPCVTFPKYLV
jgi:hypothetical protein